MIEFQYTAPDRPQQNGHIKRKFATLFNWVCAMLNGSKFKIYKMQPMERSCKHCHASREQPDHSQQDPKPISTIFWKGKEKCPSMQKFGAMCIATYKNESHWTKLANLGTPSIRVGYKEGHPTSIYRIFDPKTKKIS